MNVLNVLYNNITIIYYVSVWGARVCTGEERDSSVIIIHVCLNAESLIGRRRRRRRRDRSQRTFPCRRHDSADGAVVEGWGRGVGVGEDGGRARGRGRMSSNPLFPPT